MPHKSQHLAQGHRHHQRVRSDAFEKFNKNLNNIPIDCQIESSLVGKISTLRLARSGEIQEVVKRAEQLISDGDLIGASKLVESALKKSREAPEY